MAQNKGEGASTEWALVEKGIALQEPEEDEIDLLDMAAFMLSKLHYIVLFLLLGALLFNAYAYFFIHPTYKATSSIYIVSNSGGTVVDLTDLDIGSKLIGSTLQGDYLELITSYPVMERVASQLDLNWSPERLSKAISVSNPSDTRVLTLTATASSPKLAMNIANTTAAVAVQYLPEEMGTEAPIIIQEAQLPRSKASPNYPKYIMIGGFLGALLCCAWFLAKYLLDDAIYSAEDLEKLCGAAPLTVIPCVDLLTKDEAE